MNYYRIHFRHGCLEVVSVLDFKSFTDYISNSKSQLIMFIDKNTEEEKFVKASSIFLVEQWII